MYYSISTKQYNRNRDKSPGWLKFKRKQGTIEDLKDDVKNERAFCHCFNQKDVFGMHEKSQANFEAAYFIVLDLDAVKLTAGEFYGKTIGTDYTPSMVYTTCNDGKFKPNKGEEYSNRYRVIYVLDEAITDAGVYAAVHDGLKHELGKWIGDEKNYFNDNSDSGADHMFAGCADADIFYNNNVTSTRVLVDKYPPDDNQMVQNTPCRSIIYREEREYYTTIGAKMDHPYRDFVNDFFDGKDFLALQSAYYMDLPEMVTKKLYKFEKGKLYAKVDEDDVNIVLKRVKVKIKGVSGDEIEVWEYYKWKDGQRRRQKLYMYLQQVRKATNYAREELLWQAVNWVLECTDNTKDPITIVDIIKTIGQVMTRDWHPSEKSKKKYGRKLSVNTELAKKKNINPQRIGLAAAHQARQDDKTKLWVEISFLYDMKLTEKENLRIMADAGLELSAKQLRAWKEANDMTNKSKEHKKNLIRKNYDPSISIAKNAKRIGLPVSTVKRLLKEIKAYPDLENQSEMLREAF